ncbi:heterokaryon incompatibility protein-domain-containing protein [Xylariaceae sp. FL1019]|nr:heterokaryon incompatibility protein-domain-containing protein [Xylariaceae sp. FL1019]
MPSCSYLISCSCVRGAPEALCLWFCMCILSMGPYTNIRQSNSTCPFCSFDTSNSDETLSGKGISLLRLADIAFKGCSICWSLLKQLNGINRRNGYSYLDNIDVYYVSTVPGGSAHYLSERSGLPLAKGFKSKTRLPTDSIHPCLRACLRTHENCREDTEPGWLPSRLIDVRQLKLRLSTDISRVEDHQYVALSHEWGVEPFFTLTKDNLDDLKVHIPYQTLRPTFQEAIDITRELGISFLWIDCLCIVQGKIHQSEWHREAGTMASIYRNAILTIAVSNYGEIDSEFGDRSVRVENPMTTSVVLSQDPRRSLTRRAWALQESILGSRTVHVVRGNPTFIWKCRETTVKLFGSHLFTFPVEQTEKIWMSRLIQTRCDRLWTNIVTNYSECSLTDPNDKLVALSGLAKTFMGAINAKYLAGVWDRYLIQGLLWRTGCDPKTEKLYFTKHERTATAPSWSWASIKGPLTFDVESEHIEPVASLEKSSMTPMATDEFGALQSGSITIRSRLLKVGVWDGRFTGVNYGFLTVDPDEETSRGHGQLFLLVMAKTNDECSVDFPPYRHYYYCLLVCQKTCSNLLRGPVYRRIGMARFNRDEPGERWDNASTLQHRCSADTIWSRCLCLLYPRRSDNKGPRNFTIADFEETPMQSITLV